MEEGFNSILESSKTKGYEVIMSYKGVLTSEKVNSLAYELENLMIEKGEKKGIVKSVFSIIIETLQNIRLHGEKDLSGIQNAYLIVTRTHDEYVISTGSFIQNMNRDKVEKKIQYINGLDKATLKEYYMQILTDGERSSKGGAGLGFITIAMKSKNKVNYKFSDVASNLNLFSMDSRVSLN